MIEIRNLREADAAAWWRLRLEALESEPLAFGMSAEEHRDTTVETSLCASATLPRQISLLAHLIAMF